MLIVHVGLSFSTLVCNIGNNVSKMLYFYRKRILQNVVFSHASNEKRYFWGKLRLALPNCKCLLGKRSRPIGAVYLTMRRAENMMTSSNGNIFRVTGLLCGNHWWIPHKGQWHGALMFSLICAWINGWVNNREAGDLIRHHSHYDVTVMKSWKRASEVKLMVKYSSNSLYWP